MKVSIGVPFEKQPRFLVQDKLGRPLAGKTVVAMSAGSSFEDYTFAFLQQEPLMTRNSVMGNFTSLPSNAAGVAVFEGLSITQSALRSSRIMFVCETVVYPALQYFEVRCVASRGWPPKFAGRRSSTTPSQLVCTAGNTCRCHTRSFGRTRSQQHQHGLRRRSIPAATSCASVGWTWIASG